MDVTAPNTVTDGTGSGNNSLGVRDLGVPGTAQNKEGTEGAGAATKPVTLADIKAARRTEQAKPGDQQPETDKTQEQVQAKPDAAKTEADKTLETFKSLRKELEEKSARLAEAEQAMTEAAIVRKARELKQQGKHYDAIKLLELDFDAAAREVMGLEPEQTSEKEQEIEALKAKIAELEGQTKDLVKSKAELDAEKAAQVRANGLKMICDQVKAAKDKYPFLSRSDKWIEQALKTADEDYLRISAERSKDKKPDLTDEEKEQLITAALTKGEALRAEEAAIYGASAKPAQEPEQVRPGITSDIRRGTVRPQPKEPGLKTIQDVKRARRQRASA